MEITIDSHDTQQPNIYEIETNDTDNKSVEIVIGKIEMEDDNTELIEKVAQLDNTELIEKVTQLDNTELIEKVAQLDNTELIEKVTQLDNTELIEKVAQLDNTELIEKVVIEKPTSAVSDVRDAVGYDYILKFIVVGNSCVGKSNISLRFTKNEFIAENETTIGVEFAAKIVCIGKTVYKLQIWDTAGQDTFKTITRSYYRNSIGCIIAYDISNRESFEAIKTWHEELIERSQPYTGRQTIAIVGNKMDKKSKRVVPYAEGEALAKELGTHFYEASAKTGQNVKTIFCDMVTDIDEKVKTFDINLIKSDNIVTLSSTDDYLNYSSCAC
jgi:small GTP-binding protein